jgi:hypothetical protein
MISLIIMRCYQSGLSDFFRKGKSEFSWIPIEMVEIGTMYMPLCEVDIQTKSGQWITFSFKVDSGADMTLMEVDNCYSLGFDLNGCKQIDSTSSRDTKFPTFIRKLKMKIGVWCLSHRSKRPF